MAGETTLSDLQVFTEALGGSPLSLAAQRGEAPDIWYRRRPGDVDEWRTYARGVAAQFSSGEWLSALRPALEPSGESAERLRRVVAGRGVVVTSGQQPGLFGGPVYTFSKALSALALADELEARTAVPVAPIFWAATDDADFGEASWTKVAIDGAVARLALRRAPRAGTPMAATPLGDVTAELAELERASGSAAFATALDAVRNAYLAGATVGGAFVLLLRALLEPLGVAVLDASHAAVRRQGARVLRGALDRAAATAAALRARTAELRAAGFEPQVLDLEELSLVFSLRGGRKQRIRIDEAPEVAQSADPAMLSTNVLLRPVLERAIVPTLAYVAGPAELGYFAQVSAVADLLGVERPLAVPRWSGTIVEPHVDQILRRLEVVHGDLGDPHALEGKLARARLPETVAAALARVRDAVDRATAALAADPEASTLVPEAAVTGAKRSILARLQRVERRYVAGVKRREVDLMRQVATARAHLFPDGERQERALNFIPMLARNGPPLIAAMRAAASAHAVAV
ncbi:MAG: bacillithiol biosynthesis BshC, partial [Gemmatimonadota bacterium]|nr:bacillithiol biosynthesis BshC [Gemmatimonadota bacterium]